jgi:hypothetical protein
MGRFVIAGYKPRADQGPALRALVKRHWPALRDQALVSARSALVMRADDGTIVEVFEWLSPQSVARAHDNPVVQALWAEFAAVCDFVPVGGLAEAARLFSEFESLAD